MGSVGHVGIVEEVVIGRVYVGGRCDVTRWEGCPGSGSVHCGGNTSTTSRPLSPLLGEWIAKRQGCRV